jgi:hypothetical protein
VKAGVKAGERIISRARCSCSSRRVSERAPTTPVGTDGQDGNGTAADSAAERWRHDVAHAEAEEAAPRPSFVNRIVAASLRQRLLVVLAAGALAGAGFWSFKRLPVDAYPDLSPPMVEVITQWPGHAARRSSD